MKQVRNILSVAIIASFIFGFFSCDKEKMAPIVNFVNEPGYQVNDTVLAVGDTIKVLLDMTWNGKNRIKEVEMKVNDQVVGKNQIDIDQGKFSITIIKGLPETEIWDFIITDEAGNSASLSLTLTKDPNSIYSGLTYFDSIFLGAQSNVARPGFMSLSNATYYTLEAAFMNQSLVDLLFYFDENDKGTLASPGADLADGIYSGVKAPGLWPTRNTTYFQKVDILVEEFYGMYHDAYVKENFDDDIAVKKASELASGDIYLFKLENGTKGIFLVLSVVEGIDGELNIGIKIQE